MEALSSHVSRTVVTRLVLPPDTNHMGTIFGGTVLSYIDEIAAIAAMKHSRKVVVTASIDTVNFLSSAEVGDILTLEACVISTGRTSMEVFVKVESEDLESGEKTLTTTSILSMVAKDEEGRPTPVPGVIPQTEEEESLLRTAKLRKQRRLEMRNQ
ncbi:acyl-CoA thioesterase [Bacillus salacetis]|nr:acyl-CoA thioesterase [Bacillus salacetis]